MGVPDASDSRLAALTRWLVEDLGFSGASIETASADASFRRYFRVTRGGESHIAMDAPPDKEDIGPFVHVARLMAQVGLNVPAVLARDSAQGFLLLSDLGSRHYLDELKAGREVDRLYADALGALVALQTADAAAAHGLPAYDRPLLLRELGLFPEWFLERHLRLRVADAERGMLSETFEILAAEASSQPRVLVHRDYHSRNLLLTEANNPGILDFQDAVFGPVTYDAVSLLKDCYIMWPTQRVRSWLAQYLVLLQSHGVAVGVSLHDFTRWFDLMGVQRHLKVLGIFARLYYRDGKAGYLADLPRVLDYVRTTAAVYPETAALGRYLDSAVQPMFEAAQARTSAAVRG